MMSFVTNLFLVLRHHRATGQSTCSATRTLAEVGADLGYHGCHDVVLLELAGSRMLPGKKSDLPDGFSTSTNEKRGAGSRGTILVPTRPHLRSRIRLILVSRYRS